MKKIVEHGHGDKYYRMLYGGDNLPVTGHKNRYGGDSNYYGGDMVGISYLVMSRMHAPSLLREWQAEPKHLNYCYTAKAFRYGKKNNAIAFQ